ncbi:MAG: hypothetical protein ACXWLM_05745, partial [Myxococcales bacterium]
MLAGDEARRREERHASFASAAQDAARFLDAHPDASPEALAQHVRAAGLRVSALSLAGGRALAIADDRPEAPGGLFFVATATPDGRHSIVHDSFADGVLVDSIHPLPPAANGHGRFYVEGTARRPAGGTGPAQISLWEWDGHRLVALLVTDYQTSLDTPGEIRFDGELLHVPTKEPLETFSTCGT